MLSIMIFWNFLNVLLDSNCLIRKFEMWYFDSILISCCDYNSIGMFFICNLLFNKNIEYI